MNIVEDKGISALIHVLAGHMLHMIRPLEQQRLFKVRRCEEMGVCGEPTSWSWSQSEKGEGRFNLRLACGTVNYEIVASVY